MKLHYSSYSLALLNLYDLTFGGSSCSSADEGDDEADPQAKAMREKERRQANNAREK